MAYSPETQAILTAVVNGEHTCPYTWCRSDRPGVDEHWSNTEIIIGDHSQVGIVSANAFVTVEPDGKVWDDEIELNIYGKDRAELTMMSLTDTEAAQIRDMLDAAITHRAEVRGNTGDAAGEVSG